jgi:hypothetical protein
MFNTLNHVGNAKENNIEIPSHSRQNGNHQENKQQQVLVRTGCAEEVKPYTLLVGM